MERWFGAVEVYEAALAAVDAQIKRLQQELEANHREPAKPHDPPVLSDDAQAKAAQKNPPVVDLQPKVQQQPLLPRENPFERPGRFIGRTRRLDDEGYRHQRNVAITKRELLLLLIGKLQRELMDDMKGAAQTFQEEVRDRVLMNEPLNKLTQRLVSLWAKTIAAGRSREELSSRIDQRNRHDRMYATIGLHELIVTLSRSGHVENAMGHWRRYVLLHHLCQKPSAATMRKRRPGWCAGCPRAKRCQRCGANIFSRSGGRVLFHDLVFLILEDPQRTILRQKVRELQFDVDFGESLTSSGPGEQLAVRATPRQRVNACTGCSGMYVFTGSLILIL